MGNKISLLFAPLLDYPLKRKPICFYRQEDFASTGEPLEREEGKFEPAMSLKEYQDLVRDFHAALLAKREGIQRQTIGQWYNEMVKDRFSGWDVITVTYLHSLFLLFDQAKTGTLSLDDFCALLDSLGNGSAMEERKLNFSIADTDLDGRITYDEFLRLMYNFNTSRFGLLGAVAQLCNEVAENMEFVNSLSVGEQLSFGLF